MQTYPSPNLLCGGHREFLGDTGNRPEESQKRVYVRKIEPEKLVKKSARKMKAAIQSQKEHDAKRRKCEREGKTPDEPATFRQEFCAHGANSTINQRWTRTLSTTRRAEITTRRYQALEKLKNDNEGEISRQLRENFLVQSTRTTQLVEKLFKQFEEKLKLSSQQTTLDCRILAENKDFVREFSQVRGYEDYVKMVQAHGIEYALTAGQCEELGRYLNLDRSRWRSAVLAAEKIQQELEELLKKLKRS